LQDSFFRVEGRSDATTTSSFAGLPPHLRSRDLAQPPDDVGGVVIETPVAKPKH
jgi:hypothetical protein